MSARHEPRRERTLLIVLAVLVTVAVLTAVTRESNDSPGARGKSDAPVAAAKGSGDAGVAALAALGYQEGNDDRYAERAAAGFSHPLFSQVPGGALATAKRVSAWREQIEQAASADGSPVDADTLEALVYLESAGRPNAASTGKMADAVGLTQIMGETANSLLGMEIDLQRSQALTDEIAKTSGRVKRWRARGSATAAARGTAKLRALRIERAGVDSRFVPASALAAAVRYLAFAERELGREDLALASYHMGVGNLQGVLSAYGRSNVSYVQLYFDVDPKRSPKAYARLSRFADDSATYYWRLLAAKRIMRQYREDSAALAREAELVTAKASREDYLHPPADNPPFQDAGELAGALEDETLLPLPVPALNANGVAVSPAMGELAGRLKTPASRYRALRRGPLAALTTIGAAVNELTPGDGVLVVTSTVRDVEYQQLLQRETVQATRGYSLHTSGWAVDAARSYASRRQALMFEFVLTRMQALGLITWVREPSAIHFTAASDSTDRLGPVLEVALGRS